MESVRGAAGVATTVEKKLSSQKFEAVTAKKFTPRVTFTVAVMFVVVASTVQFVDGVVMIGDV